jgi:hypothetical protein
MSVVEVDENWFKYTCSECGENTRAIVDINSMESGIVKILEDKLMEDNPLDTSKSDLLYGRSATVTCCCNLKIDAECKSCYEKKEVLIKFWISGHMNFTINDAGSR